MLGIACDELPWRREHAARLRGRELYLANCATCHGERGDGRGERRDALDPKPRDYTDPRWRAQATEESVYEAITHGVAGTAMPAWDLLSEEKRRDLTLYVLSLAGSGSRVDGEDDR